MQISRIINTESQISKISSQYYRFHRKINIETRISKIIYLGNHAKWMSSTSFCKKIKFAAAAARVVNLHFKMASSGSETDSAEAVKSVDILILWGDSAREGEGGGVGMRRPVLQQLASEVRMVS